MRRFRWPAAALLLVSCSSAGLFRMHEAAIDAIMRDYDGPDRPGASVLVYRRGKVVFRKGYGLADVDAGIPAAPDTNYRLASVTKQFTAAAILRLAERGAISLDDPVRGYLPSLPAETAAVTVRHLLTHSSGLVDYEDVMAEDGTGQILDAGVLRLLETQRTLHFRPGEGYRYSNSGYALLALVVERVSGGTFADFLRQEIFLPLGMAGTVAHQEGVSEVARRAYGHSRGGDGWKRTDQSRTSAVLGDGGVYSSVADLARWLEALDGGAFAEAAIPRVATADPGVQYGYGWRISEHNGRRMVFHTGETIGFRSALIRFPDQRLSVAVLTNREGGTPRALALRIADSFE